MKSIKKIIVITFGMVCFLIGESFASTGVVNATAVRVRKSQDTSSDIITIVYEDDEVEILENNGEWCKIEVDEYTGYVKTEFLKISDSSSTSSSSDSTTSDSTTTNDATTSTDSTTSDSMTTNDATTSASSATSDSTTTSDATTATDSVESDTTNATTEVSTSTQVSVRLSPSITSKIVSTINVSSQITQILEMNNWVKVTDGTTTGWIPKVKLSTTTQSQGTDVQSDTSTQETTEQTSQTDTTDETVEETTVNKTGTINVETAKLRSEPSTSSTVVEFLDYGDQVTILSEEGDWYKITSGSLSGYVSKSLVTISVSSRSLTESREETIQEDEEDDTVANQQVNSSVNDALSDVAEVQESTATTTGNQIAEFAKQFLGYPYVSGGKSPSTGFDCSGFTKYVYSNFGYTLGNTAASQTSLGTDVSMDNLSVGDLILFYDEGKTKIGHTGIYIGDGNFVHAANANRGVVIDNLNTSSYYNSRFVTAKRIVE